MTVPFHRAATTARAMGGEAAALAGHLLRYPAGIPQEPWPRLPPPCPPYRPPAARPPTATASAAASVAGPGTGGPALRPPDGDGDGDGNHDGDGPAAPGTVLLLHGLIDNRSVFSVLRRSLHRHGWQHVHALNYSPLTADVRAAAVLLGRHVEQARRLHGHERIALVGHSLGGLIGRYYVQRLGGDQHVHSLVTLGAPHSGTLAARLPSLMPITRQLRPDSDLFAELREPAPGCRTRFAAFWSDLDQLVLPAGFARLDHPDLEVENILVPGVGHLTLTVHGTVLAGVRGFLRPRSTCGEGAAQPEPGPPDRLTA